MGCPSLVLQLLSCGFVSAFVVSDSPIILIICVTFHCLIILLILGALIGNKEFVSCILYFVFSVTVSVFEQNSRSTTSLDISYPIFIYVVAFVTEIMQ